MFNEVNAPEKFSPAGNFFLRKSARDFPEKDSGPSVDPARYRSENLSSGG
jgi:hypothetical protein